MSELDWNKAEEHLKSAEQAYASIGSPGMFALNYVIRPARGRFNDGERTEELYNEIMDISL